ncbi:MAG: hypothetical protein ACPG7R_01435, partial [Planctomycetota bacterium]
MSSQENTPEIQGDEDLRMIRRALVTVSDKTGVVDFCQHLEQGDMGRSSLEVLLRRLDAAAPGVSAA